MSLEGSILTTMAAGLILWPGNPLLRLVTDKTPVTLTPLHLIKMSCLFSTLNCEVTRWPTHGVPQWSVVDDLVQWDYSKCGPLTIIFLLHQKTKYASCGLPWPVATKSLATKCTVTHDTTDSPPTYPEMGSPWFCSSGGRWGGDAYER